MITDLDNNHKYVLDKMKNFLADVGYDKQRKCLRYGYRYEDKGKVFRIPISTDRRIFLLVARDSQKYKRLYKSTEVERLNERIDKDYMFNDHFIIRGKKKMNMMLTLTFIIILSMVKGHIKNNQKSIRSLVN